MKYKKFFIFNKDIGDGINLMHNTHLATSVIDLNFYTKNKQHLTCVIEYAAYEKLQEQNKKLKSIAERASKLGCNPIDQHDCLACDAVKTLKEIESEK